MSAVIAWGQMSTWSSSCDFPAPSGAHPPAPGPSSRVICVSYHHGVNSTSPSWRIHGTKHPSMRPGCAAAAPCCCEEVLILLLDSFGLFQGEEAGSAPGISPVPSAGPGTSLKLLPRLFPKSKLNICSWVPHRMFLCIFLISFLLPALFPKGIAQLWCRDPVLTATLRSPRAVP